MSRLQKGRSRAGARGTSVYGSYNVIGERTGGIGGLTSKVSAERSARRCVEEGERWAEAIGSTPSGVYSTTARYERTATGKIRKIKEPPPSYWVWHVDPRTGQPLTSAPLNFMALSLEEAIRMAEYRNRVVSHGSKPLDPDFEIVRVFRKGSKW